MSKLSLTTNLTSSYLDAVFLSLGSNQGDRLEFIRSSISALNALPACVEIEVSQMYETAAWGRVEQPDFLNCVVKMKINRELYLASSESNGDIAHVEQLLRDLRLIEDAHGRQRTSAKWSARTIDIDILIYNDTCFQSSTLTIPHFQMCQRKFVLIPLADLAPELQIPGTGASVRTLLNTCTDHSRVSLFKIKADLGLNMLSSPTAG